MFKSKAIIGFCCVALLFFSNAGWADQRAIKRNQHSKTNSQNRIALVIGNSNYRLAPLQNPVNDATDMARALEQCGFKVIKKLDADQPTIEKAIHDFGGQLREGVTGLFYFSGHGVQIKGGNYLIPIKADITKDIDVKYKAVNMGLVLDEMGSARNGMNIVILDACRNNPLTRSWRSHKAGLAQTEGPSGTLIAFSTSPGSVAADGQGRNGTYTKHLLAALKTPNLPVEMVFKKVIRGVKAESRNKQVPWISSSFTGDFYFYLQQTGKLTPQAPAPLNIAAPPDSKLGLTDFEEAFKARQERTAERQRLQQQWSQWQKNMQADYRRTQTLSRNDQGQPKEKAEIWARFLAVYNKDNPFSQADEDLRSQASQQQARWLAEAQSAKKKKPLLASISPSVSSPRIVATDRHYEKLASGIVYDKNSGLEWFVGPDERTNWGQAKKWVDNLSTGGGGWRMPTVKELEGLYSKDVGDRNMTPLLKTKGWVVWSGEKTDSGAAWGFNFYLGLRYWDGLYSTTTTRGFAVRSRR